MVRLESTTSMAVFKGKRFVKVLPLHIVEVFDSVFSGLHGVLFCFVLSMCRVVKFLAL